MNAQPLPPIRRQVVVRTTPEHAFAAWTDNLSAWWPFEPHSVYGATSTAAFVDGELVETGPDGAQSLWGTVTDWSPGRGLTMTWHPGQKADAATTVHVQFDALDDDRTLVTLTHTGWERRADGAAARQEYRRGWPTVMSRFSDDVARSSTVSPKASADVSWLVLQHTAAPDLDGSVFESPLFAEHIAFLKRADSRGWLVAAGNLSDSPGAGMTVLRVPSSEVADAVQAAQDDDVSVSDGLFDVQVRPWNVALSA